MTLSEGQSHSHWYQRVKSGHVYHHQCLKEIGSKASKHKLNLNIFSSKSPKLSSLLWILIMQHNISMSLNRPTGHGSIKFHPPQICKKKSTKNLFLYNCYLEWGSGHSHWYQTKQFNIVYHCTQFERNHFVNVWIHADIFFVMKSHKLESLPWVKKTT